VVETDAACGKLIAALEEAGVADNTIIIFSADNGPEYYAYPRDKKFDHWSAEPLRGLKRDIYEGGHRVPFIVKWPGVTKAGRVSDALVSQIDLMATLAAGLRYELPDDQAVDSYNLLPLLTGKSDVGRHSHIHNTFKNAYAMRHGDWLLIDAKTGYHNRGYAEWEKKRDYPADNASPVELYHLSEDLGQSKNLAGQHPDKVVELQALMKKIREQGYSAPRLVK
jgi:arylsulfatase A